MRACNACMYAFIFLRLCKLERELCVYSNRNFTCCLCENAHNQDHNKCKLFGICHESLKFNLSNLINFIELI